MDLSQALQRLSGLTIREKEAQENQAKMDVVYLLNTADEYVRWIGSVRVSPVTLLSIVARTNSRFPSWPLHPASSRTLPGKTQKRMSEGSKCSMKSSEDLARSHTSGSSQR
jgi:hypothetical protein